MSDGYTCPVRVTYDARLANLKAFFVVEVAKEISIRGVVICTSYGTYNHLTYLHEGKNIKA